ncbi:hypothetical protein ACMHYB_21605 [Sorangium sp. So ce1128]
MIKNLLLMPSLVLYALFAAGCSKSPGEPQTGVITASLATAPECGCIDTGLYKSLASNAPVAQEQSPGGTYRLETNPTSTGQKLSVKRVDTNVLVQEFEVATARLAFGFSPDGDRFTYSYADPQQDHHDKVFLYDLAADQAVFNTQVTEGASVAFSPHGRWFVLNVLLGTQDSELTVVDSQTGQTALYAPLHFETVPGYPGDKFGTMGFGFSSEPGDRSFVWAYRPVGYSTQLLLRNLETRTTVATHDLASDSWWQFSPCGDALAVVNQPSPAGVIVTVHKTAVPNEYIGAEKVFSPVPAKIALETTLANHHILTTDAAGQVTTTIVGSNTADAACPSAAALGSLTVSPTTVVGGEAGATATVSLTALPTSAFSVSLSSSDPATAAVPSSVTVSAGTSSKLVTVTTQPVTAPKTVTLTATAGGVTRTTTLVVNPAPARALDGLSIEPGRPMGGSPATGTVTLTGPAPSSGTVVTLVNSAPAAAAVPASVTVPSGQSTATFTIGTSSVRGDTPVRITATAGGVSRTARLMVLTADRTCNGGQSYTATETIEVRAFSAYDDAGQNADCGQAVYLNNGITVGAGSTNLPVGTPVQLQVTVRFDGIDYTSPPLYSGGAVADGGGWYAIKDDAVLDTEEAYLNVVDFSVGFELQQDPGSVYDNVYKRTHVYLSTNVDEPISQYTSEEASSIDAVVIEADTGTVTVTYATTVGAHLSIDGRFSTVASAYGTGTSAVADFSFQASTTPAPGFEGLALTYDL